jgi:hypothetical protein
MKKLFIIPAALLCCSLLFANNGSKNKKQKAVAEKATKEKKVENKQADNTLNVSKGTPVVTYKNYKVSRTGSKQIVPAE